jgi:hypothetical protein
MIKMDRIWVATASLIYPDTSADHLVTSEAILQEINRLFPTQITPVMITRHLVSWVDRQAHQAHPSRGGSRNRYLFRTRDGRTPSGQGDLRLYKEIDSQFDGIDKIGRVRPEENQIPAKYHILLEWHNNEYFPGH